jgi:hypothetical protein
VPRVLFIPVHINELFDPKILIFFLSLFLWGCVCVYYRQLVDLPTDALLSHLNHNNNNINGMGCNDPPSFYPPPVPPSISPFDPTTSYYQVVVDDANFNNNNYAPLKVMARRPLSVIHEESLFNHFL